MAVEMRSVRFAYPQLPNVPVLNGLDLSVQPGQFCALVGPSGAGKSTIFSLLESFYMPSSGTVYLDNRSIATTATPPHRSSISLVPQSSTLFFDTISFNIALAWRSPLSCPHQRRIRRRLQASKHSFSHRLAATGLSDALRCTLVSFFKWAKTKIMYRTCIDSPVSLDAPRRTDQCA